MFPRPLFSIGWGRSHQGIVMSSGCCLLEESMARWSVCRLNDRVGPCDHGYLIFCHFFKGPSWVSKHLPLFSRGSTISLLLTRYVISIPAWIETESGIRSVSMGSVNARFHILARHQDWNETIRETTQAMEHFTLLFPRLSKVFNCRKMIGSYVRWWNDLTLNGVSLGYQSMGNNAYEFHHGETLFFSPLSISYKTCLFADVSRY
jgi:hypothetical protein